MKDSPERERFTGAAAVWALAMTIAALVVGLVWCLFFTPKGNLYDNSFYYHR